MAGKIVSNRELDVDEPKEQGRMEMELANLAQEEGDQMQSNKLELVEPGGLPKTCKSTEQLQTERKQVDHHPRNKVILPWATWWAASTEKCSPPHKLVETKLPASRAGPGFSSLMTQSLRVPPSTEDVVE